VLRQLTVANAPPRDIDARSVQAASVASWCRRAGFDAIGLARLARAPAPLERRNATS
jgi:hypothetical protein